MNKDKRKLLLLLFGMIVLFNNCATTKLIRTEVDYRPVMPPKSRLICNYTIPQDVISPIITVQIVEEKLSEKVETNYYKTNYGWRNKACCLGFTALPVLATIKWWNYYEIRNDTAIYTGRILGILGTLLCLGAMAAYPDFPWHPKAWQKEQIFSQDTSYQFSSPISSNLMVQISSYPKGEQKSIRPDRTGKVDIDIRDFFGFIEEDSDLILKISQAGLSTSIKIPANYIKMIKDYENEANILYEQALSDETVDRNEALKRCNLLIEKYPKAQVKVSQIQEILKKEKIAKIRKELQMVSSEKIKNIIPELVSDYESEQFGSAIINLSKSYAISVIKNGLGMPLTDTECSEEYRNLTLYQKFYAILCYKDNLTETYEKSPVEELSRMLYISNTTAEKLVRINPKNLVYKIKTE